MEVKNLMKLTTILDEEYTNVKSATINNIQIDTKFLNHLVNAWEEIAKFPRKNSSTHPKDLSPKIEEKVKDLKYTKDDITAFSFFMEENHKSYYESTLENLGLYLNALISLDYNKNKKTDEYILSIEKYGREICFFGYEFNGPNVHLVGDLGRCAFQKMHRGKATIEGNVGISLGNEMTRGKIIVKKDALFSFANGMKGGVIHIQGNANGLIGEYMSGGIIHVNGDKFYGVHITFYNGKIYWKEKKIKQ